MKIYTGGTFDLFHAGHVRFLARCNDLALLGRDAYVVVSVNRDDFVERFKGRRPVRSLEQRMEDVRMTNLADEVIVNEGDEDSKPAILMTRPDVVAIDQGWACEDYYKQMSFTQEWLDDNGIQLVYLPRTPNISTTILRAAMDR